MSAGSPLVFVVDDDRGIREALCEYLSGWSFSPRPAAGGRELDLLLQEEIPDAIILDIMMSGEDGLAICKRLNGRFPVLMLSALGDTSDRIVGLELGPTIICPNRSIHANSSRGYRPDDARNAATGGSGLGLSIVRAIARTHGGDALLIDLPSGGLEAQVRFPLATA